MGLMTQNYVWKCSKQCYLIEYQVWMQYLFIKIAFEGHEMFIAV